MENRRKDKYIFATFYCLMKMCAWKLIFHLYRQHLVHFEMLCFVCAGIERARCVVCESEKDGGEAAAAELSGDGSSINRRQKGSDIFWRKFMSVLIGSIWSDWEANTETRILKYCFRFCFGLSSCVTYIRNYSNNNETRGRQRRRRWQQWRQHWQQKHFFLSVFSRWCSCVLFVRCITISEPCSRGTSSSTSISRSSNTHIESTLHT